MSVVVKKTETNAVTVCVRIRPRNAAEKAADMAVVMKATVRFPALSYTLFSYLHFIHNVGRWL
jgi:hypothetical protein